MYTFTEREKLYTFLKNSREPASPRVTPESGEWPGTFPMVGWDRVKLLRKPCPKQSMKWKSYLPATVFFIDRTEGIGVISKAMLLPMV